MGEKKNSESCYYLKQPQKIPQQLQKILPHATIFFLQVMNKNTRKKKNNQKKTKQAREKEIMFLFLTPRFRKKKTTKLQNPRKHKKQANKKNKTPAKKPNEIYS